MTVQIVSLILLPFSKKVFNAINHYGSGKWWQLVQFLGKITYGTHVTVTGDPLSPTENVLLIPNHQQMTDIVFIIFVALQYQSAGHTKWFVKDTVKYVPLLGWSMLFLNNLFVKRSWSKDRNMIEKTFSKIKKHNERLWLILFAEGTRIDPKKIATSQRILKRKNRRINEHVLVPHTKGFVASITGLDQHLDAVYDMTIGYETGVPSLWQLICGYTRHVQVHVKRHPISQLPETNEALSDWLFDRFEDKDKLLNSYYETGTFS